VIAVTSIFEDEKVRGKIEDFVRKRFPGSFDCSVSTALIVLVHAGPQDHFRDFYKSLGDLTKNKKDIDRLREFWDSGFRDPIQGDGKSGTPLKIWDGFTFTVGKEGGPITYGKSYRYWISFK
jgi:hypothetical protein